MEGIGNFRGVGSQRPRIFQRGEGLSVKLCFHMVKFDAVQVSIKIVSLPTLKIFYILEKIAAHVLASVCTNHLLCSIWCGRQYLLQVHVKVPHGLAEMHCLETSIVCFLHLINLRNFSHPCCKSSLFPEPSAPKYHGWRFQPPV